MIVNKVIIGFVTQRFDTETGKFLDQEFHGSDDRQWENQMGESIDPPEVGGEEPYLNMEMVQPIISLNQPVTKLFAEISHPFIFSQGDRVIVTPLGNGEPPEQEFEGTVVGIKDNQYVQVRDGDNNVFDCEPKQVTLSTDEF